MRTAISRVAGVALPNKIWLVALVGCLWPPYDTTNDASSQGNHHLSDVGGMRTGGV